jgi:hypothetical protein
MTIYNKISTADKVGSAVRYQNPKGSRWFRNDTGRKLYIEPAALKYVENLNGYDQHQVCKSIEALASIPSPLEGMVSQQRPSFLKAKKANSTAVNFIIKYRLTSHAVVISHVVLNAAVLGPQPVTRNERTSLYNVNKIGKTKFGERSTVDDVRHLPATWSVSDAVTGITTEHAAVNGMLNELNKAAWLMGVHAEHAYPDDNLRGFTLFHNPSEGAALDFYESVCDNVGIATRNAKYLAAVLSDVQRKGKPVKWVVHSQGGIIFKQALAYHLKRNPGQILDKNTVVFHAGGNNKRSTDKLLAQAGIQKASPDKDNPFDLVPNIAGGNNLGLGAIKRSLQFWGKVKGTETSSPIESPHTLPYISLEAYHHFLSLAGDTTAAARVQDYMQKLTKPS